MMHHEADKYSPYATVINNQLSKNYPNKSLSGVGVVYKFFEYFEGRINSYRDFADSLPKIGHPSENYLDLVALGQISDVMNMNTLENRWICDYGLSHIHNKFFKGLIEKQAYSLGDGELNQIGIAFYITPLINALIRVGSIYEKERLFQAFITPDVEVDSTKRGEKGKKETICTQSIRNCVNAKARQTRERDKAAELLDIQIMDNCLDENKILILNADELNIPTTLTGLCAMGVAAKYKKPVLLGRLTSDGKLLRGSIRNKDGSPLKNLKDFLMESGQMEYVEGHQEAAGFSMASCNIDKLTEYANTVLQDVDFSEGSYDVDFIVRNNSLDLKELITDLCRGAKYYGQGNPEPMIAVENIVLDKYLVQAIGANSDTMRFSYNGIVYIKFRAKDILDKLNEHGNKLLINVVGKGQLNHWGGSTTPQIVIEDIEFKDLEGF